MAVADEMRAKLEAVERGLGRGIAAGFDAEARAFGELCVSPESRALVGRSTFSDILLEEKGISRQHAFLIQDEDALVVIDLRSRNGTFVNSRRISNHVLMHDDVIAVGHHRIKFSDPHATQRGALDGAEFADTAIMKTLDDMRNLLSQENTAILPAAGSEDLPTLG